MTFDELLLACAVRQAGHGSDTPRRESQRRDLARRVVEAWLDVTGDTRFPFGIDDIVDVDTKLRKNTDTRAKADIALMHGAGCFWKYRCKGPCCDIAEAGHLVPACEGGPLSVANCVIECRAHNNQRRERTIERYLQSSDRTS